MVIRIRDFVSAANTSEEGEVVFDRLSGELSRQKTGIVVSFDGIQTATSSFVNAAFVELLNRYSYTDLKTRLKVTNSTRQINNMIKTRLARSSDMVA
jgi:STAS-like domain of unknown function (DUF4325)